MAGSRLTPADLAATLSATQSHGCPNCGTSVNPNETICPGCGIRLRKPARQIRCRHCRHRASSELVICPSCGRELRPAPSRLLMWGVPLLLVGLLALILVTQTGGSLNVGALGALFTAGPSEVDLGEITELVLIEGEMPVADIDAATEESAPAEPATQTEASSALLVVRNTSTPTPLPQPTASNSPTPTPTSTQTPVPTGTFTQTPSVVSTSGEVRYTTQSGDTLLTIAQRYDVTVDELLAVNDTLAEGTTQVSPGQVLIIPAGGSLPSATPTVTTPTATATQIQIQTPIPSLTYTLQSGDTPGIVAQRFGVTVNDLLAANNLTREDATRLQVGVVLIIPSAGQSTPQATWVPANTPTPAPTPTPTTAIRVAAPTLISPVPDTPVDCRTWRDSLAWNPVPGLIPGDEYELHLGYVNGPTDPNGNVPVAWVVVTSSPATSWRVESDYCSVATNKYNREWRWFVQVVNNGVVVSPPSETWRFYWNF